MRDWYFLFVVLKYVDLKTVITDEKFIFGHGWLGLRHSLNTH